MKQLAPILFLAFLCVLSSSVVRAAEARRNFLFILVDDQRCCVSRYSGLLCASSRHLGRCRSRLGRPWLSSARCFLRKDGGDEKMSGARFANGADEVIACGSVDRHNFGARKLLLISAI
jgi:hypothetical protein